MAWQTTADVAAFLASAGRFLESDPVRNNALLTEALFWRWLSGVGGGRFGVWEQDGAVHAAFVELPDHPVLCSPLTDEATAALPHVLTGVQRIGVEQQAAAAVTGALKAAGHTPAEVGGVTLLELGDLRPPPPPQGRPRRADGADAPLLRDWFRLFQGRFPTDPSAVEFVVDHPLEAGAVVVWEVDGRPVAMSSRTPETAGMTRMGLTFQPADGTTYADAALVAGCQEAMNDAVHVLAVSGDAEWTERYERLGFRIVCDRVLLQVG